MPHKRSRQSGLLDGWLCSPPRNKENDDNTACHFMDPIACDVDASPAAKARPEPVLRYIHADSMIQGSSICHASKVISLSNAHLHSTNLLLDSHEQRLVRHGPLVLNRLRFPGDQDVKATTLQTPCSVEATSLGQLPLADTRKKH